MNSPDFLLLYVASPRASTPFYTALFDRPPVDASENFVMFVPASGPKLGLWSKTDVKPAPVAEPGAAESAWAVPTAAAVDDLHARLSARGVIILQGPAEADFGRNFLAADPDGHRLRFFCPA